VARTEYANRQFNRQGAVDGTAYYGAPRCAITLGFRGPDPNDEHRVVSLQPAGDAFDDRGEPVTLWAQLNGPEGGSNTTVTLTIPDLSHRARALRAIEGTLAVYATARLVRVEAPWTGENTPARGSREGITVTIEHAAMTEAQISLRVRVDHPEGSAPSWNFTSHGGPIALLDAAGKMFPPDGIRFLGGESGSRYRIYHLQYRGAAEAPAAVAATVLIRSGPLSAVPFRLENIPLPDFSTLTGEQARAPEGPEGRSAVSCQVMLNGRAAGEGTLVLGLRPAGAAAQAESTASPGPTAALGWRWREVQTDARGVARMDGLAAGRYLLRRYWRPKPTSGRPSVVPDPLAWHNGLVEAELVDGKTTSLAPLLLGQSALR
jgi:hypothetical protein